MHATLLVFLAVFLAIITLLAAVIAGILVVFCAAIAKWAHDEGLLTRRSVAILEDAVSKRAIQPWEGSLVDSDGPPDPTISLIPDLDPPIPPPSLVLHPDSPVQSPQDYLLATAGVDMYGQTDQFPGGTTDDPFDAALKVGEPVLMADGSVMRDGVIVYTPPVDPTPDAPLFDGAVWEQ